MLLSPEQFGKIRDAVRSVTDTFHQKPITIHQLGTSLDRFQEGATRPSTDFNLLGFVEFEESPDAESRTEGDIRRNSCMITFNLNYLEDLGGVLDGDRNVIFKEKRDLVTFQGQKYNIDLITYDGLLEDKYELVIFQCSRDEH
jgi:hypothetical protein